MNCRSWRDDVELGFVDRMDRQQRQQFLTHLESCRPCRDAAAKVDPTLVFSLLPAAEVEDAEVDEVRRTIQALRRVRALEATWNRRVRQGLAASAFAALLLAAVVLVPHRPQPESSVEVPFAGAVGVGSGLVDLPPTPIGESSVRIRVELGRAPAAQQLSQTEFVAHTGERVERDLGYGYRMRFEVAGEVLGRAPVLKNFEVLGSDSRGDWTIFSADLRPSANQPLILGLTPAEGDEDLLWLQLTCSLLSEI